MNQIAHKLFAQSRKEDSFENKVRFGWKSIQIRMKNLAKKKFLALKRNYHQLLAGEPKLRSSI